VNAAELLPLVRELFSRNPQYRDHEPWELVWLLFSLRYTEALEDEHEIAAAATVVQEAGFEVREDVIAVDERSK
jgi:hypothetical protein